MKKLGRPVLPAHHGVPWTPRADEGAGGVLQSVRRLEVKGLWVQQALKAKRFTLHRLAPTRTWQTLARKASNSRSSPVSAVIRGRVEVKKKAATVGNISLKDVALVMMTLYGLQRIPQVEAKVMIWKSGFGGGQEANAKQSEQQLEEKHMQSDQLNWKPYLCRKRSCKCTKNKMNARC